jgi:hypothetical protein
VRKKSGRDELSEYQQSVPDDRMSGQMSDDGERLRADSLCIVAMLAELKKMNFITDEARESDMTDGSANDKE